MALTEDDFIFTGAWYDSFDSTNVFKFRWEDDFLTVQFNSGATYVYSLVPEYVARNMIRAVSKGGFIWDHIRGHFGYVRTK